MRRSKITQNRECMSVCEREKEKDKVREREGVRKGEKEEEHNNRK